MFVFLIGVANISLNIQQNATLLHMLNLAREE